MKLTRQVDQSIDRGNQVGPPFRAGHGVDLVEDHGLQSGEESLAPGRGEQDVQTLGSGDQNLGRHAEYLAPLGRRRIAAAHSNPYRLGLHTGCRKRSLEFGQGPQKILLDVVIESLERGDIENPDLSALPGPAEKAVENPQKGCQSLAAPGGGRRQNMFSGRDPRPGKTLNGRGSSESAFEPRFRDCGEGG